MGLDFSPAAVLGYKMLSDLKAAASAAKTNAVDAMALARKSANAASVADHLISDIVKINPAIAGRDVVRYVDHTMRTVPSVELFANPSKGYLELHPPMGHKMIKLDEVKSVPISVKDLPAFPIARGVDGGSCFVLASLRGGVPLLVASSSCEKIKNFI